MEALVKVDCLSRLTSLQSLHLSRLNRPETIQTLFRLLKGNSGSLQSLSISFSRRMEQDIRAWLNIPEQANKPGFQLLFQAWRVIEGDGFAGTLLPNLRELQILDPDPGYKAHDKPDIYALELFDPKRLASLQDALRSGLDETFRNLQTPICLRRLFLTECSKAPLERFILSFQGLEELIVRFNNFQPSVEAVCNHGDTLKVLSLRGSDDIYIEYATWKRADIITLGKRCPHLIELGISIDIKQNRWNIQEFDKWDGVDFGGSSALESVGLPSNLFRNLQLYFASTSRPLHPREKKDISYTKKILEDHLNDPIRGFPQSLRLVAYGKQGLEVEDADSIAFWRPSTLSKAGRIRLIPVSFEDTMYWNPGWRLIEEFPLLRLTKES
ncbi:hypothetical protein ABW19_dt0202764 [Dactylella cylindrospora]|nr:hypothetical protein ABW19_dt0202764 [Dactylella cylindrospora]